MARLALGIEYDGSACSGWQLQSHARSVQGELERALAIVADHPVHLTAAGRTDAGVHALMQVAHFDTAAVRPELAWVLGGSAEPADESACCGRARCRPISTRGSARWRGPTATGSSTAACVLHLSVPEPAGSVVRWTPMRCTKQRSACSASTTSRRSAQRSASPRRQCVALLTCRAPRWRPRRSRDPRERVPASHGTERRGHADRRRRRRPANGLGGRGARGRDRTRAGATAPPQGLYFAGVDYDPSFGLPSAPRPSGRLPPGSSRRST